LRLIIRREYDTIATISKFLVTTLAVLDVIEAENLKDKQQSYV